MSCKKRNCKGDQLVALFIYIIEYGDCVTTIAGSNKSTRRSTPSHRDSLNIRNVIDVAHVNGFSFRLKVGGLFRLSLYG